MVYYQAIKAIIEAKIRKESNVHHGGLPPPVKKKLAEEYAGIPAFSHNKDFVIHQTNGALNLLTVLLCPEKVKDKKLGLFFLIDL